MSQELFKLLREADAQNIELQLAMQCAPVLADLKVSNLLITQVQYVPNIRQIAHRLGLSCFVLTRVKKRVTLLLYRAEKLLAYLAQEEVSSFLAEMGYDEYDLSEQLRHFRNRYQTYLTSGTDFPHEMGLFLGYPVADVRGFIQNKGEHFLYTGYWKVYENLEEKKDLFQRFEEAREYLVRRVLSNRSIVSVT